MAEILFLTGIGRSGTTLFQSILNAHPLISFIPETHFIKRYIIPDIRQNKYSDASRLHADLSKNGVFNILEIEGEELLNDLMREKSGNLSARAFFRILDLKSGSCKYIGEKDPLNVFYIPALKQNFPESKVIQIVRDPRDVISSRIRSSWSKRKSAAYHTAEYAYSIRKSRMDAENLFSENYFEIRFEDLTANPEESMRKTCDFLQVDFHKSMLEHHKGAGELIRDNEMDWKENVMKPIDPDKIGQWSSSLSTRQVALIETVLGGFMKEFGYELTGKKVGMVTWPQQLLVRFWMLLFKLRFG